jgi:hypothetical protein
MLSIAWYSLGDDIFLAVTRGLISLYAIAATTTLVTWAIRDSFGHRPICVYAAGWHAMLAGIATYVFLTDLPLRPPLWVALYGSAFLGSLTGLFWLILKGRDQLVQQANEPRCNQLCANHEVVVTALKKAAQEVADHAKSLER